MANLTPSGSKINVPETLQTTNPSVPIAVADEVYVSGTAPSSGNSVKNHLDDLAAKIAAAGSGSWKGEYHVLTEYSTGDMVYWEDASNNRRFFVRRDDGRSVGNPSTRPQDWDELGITDIARLVNILVASDHWTGAWQHGHNYAAGDFCSFTQAGAKMYYERNTAGSDPATPQGEPPLNSHWTHLTGDDESAVKVLEAATDAEAAISRIATLAAQSVGLTPAQGDRGYALRRAKASEAYEFVIPPMTWRYDINGGAWSEDGTYFSGDAVSHTERLWVLTGTGHISAGLSGSANAPGAVSAWVALTDTDSHTATWAEAGNDDLIPASKFAGAYYGEWNDTSSTQDFKVGDRVAHNDRPFTCILDHRKGAHAPDIDYTNWETDEHWWGEFADYWFPLGVFSRDGGRLWWASADVARGDPRPTASGNTKWWQVAGVLPPLAWGDAWADGAYTVGTMVTDGDRLFVSKTAIVAGNPQPSTDADETYWLACDSDAGISPAAFYTHLKPSLKAGGGIVINADDDAHTLSIGTDGTPVRPIAPDVVGAFWGRAPGQTDVTATPLRLRAVDSDDLRTPHDAAYSAYFYHNANDELTINNGDTFDLVRRLHPAFPDTAEGYASTRPGFLLDPNHVNPTLNSNGVEFTAASAGSTERVFDVSVRVVPKNNREYTSDESLDIWLANDGGANRINVSKTLTGQTVHYGGGHQAPFEVTFKNVQYTGAPRSGRNDWFRVWLQPHTGSAQITAQTFNGWKVSWSLPHLGHNVVQKYDFPSALDLASIEDFGNYYLCPLAVSGADNQGASTAAKQTDKAECEVTSDGYIKALRDLRRVELTFASTHTPSRSDIATYSLISWVPGLITPYRVAEWPYQNTAFTHTATMLGLMEGQMLAVVCDTDILADDINANGAPEITWDPSIDPTDSATVAVVPGLINVHTIAFQGAARSAGDYTLGAVADLPDVTRWDALRLQSNGVRSTVIIPPDLVIPTSAGGPDKATPTLGPISIRSQSASGTIYHDRSVSIWRDGTDLKLRVYSGAAHQSTPWLDSIELEYHI